MTDDRARRRPWPGPWAGYAACACAWLFAVPSFYWSAGGTLGVDTVIPDAADVTWSSDPLAMTVVLITAFLKVLAGLLALALVRPWGLRLPGWALPAAGWGGGLLLTVYGGVQLGAQALVKSGAIADDAGSEIDRRALSWHLFLWSPWFLIWGVLLCLAVMHFQASARARGRKAG